VSGSDGAGLRRRRLFGALPAAIVVGASLRASRAAATPAAAGPAPTPLHVPEALRRRVSRVEASGLAWAPVLDRYLVAIDDTIDGDDRDRRAPFLVTLDRQGRFDEAPLEIAGLDHLDDAESICAAGPDRFFLLTSHSPNRKGRVRASRRQLVDLRLERGKLRAAARVDLAAGDGGLPALLARAGVPTPHGIDAEAIAFHGGALHVGLKAPLDGRGAALLVRLGDPARVFSAGALPTALATIARRVRLPGGPMGTVGEGLSDVVFRDDGGLFATANAPKDGVADGGGALWSLPADAHAAPTLLARFPGLKPEGLARTPDGPALVVLFDRGDAEPWWTTWAAST
jgi:hypothetical protein